MEEVDQLVKASITSIVSALGGPDLASDGHYVLGEEALACLKDLKQWLRAFDEKLHRYDVGKCISDTNLVNFDILEILAKWNQDSESETGASKKMDRIALACLELLVPLLWPIEITDDSSDNQVAGADTLRRAQIRYKRAILSHPSNVILKAIVRLSIPSVAKSKQDRDSRDIGVMKLVIFFVRNLLAIDPMLSDGGSDDINRGATIVAFEKQGVLDLLMTLSACTGYDIVGVDLPTLECLFYLVSGLEVTDLFVKSSETGQKSKLGQLLESEKRNKPASSARHSRFASTVTVHHGGAKISVTGTGGDSIEKSLQKFDNSKAPARRVAPTAIPGQVWEVPVFLGHEARDIMKSFSERFNDAAFNPLMQSVRKALEQDDDITPAFKNYLTVVRWFLGVEMAREKPDYGLVASVVNQEAFIIIMRTIRQGVTAKDWVVVKTAMEAFKSTLLVVNLLPGDDEEIAANIKARLFYEEEYLIMLADLTRRHSLPLAFLKTAVDMTHTLIKTLEIYASANTVMFVKARRQKAKKKAEVTGDTEDLDRLGNEETESTMESRERKFNFAQFEARYFQEDTFTTYRIVLSAFQELPVHYIGWSLKFIDRAFNKRKCRVMLYRLDYLQLFRTLAKNLSMSNPWRKSFEQFFKRYMRELVPMLQERPVLFVEMLFAKMNSTLHYLEKGEDKPVREIRERTSKFVYQFTEGADISDERKTSILVASLLDEEKRLLVEWFISEVGVLVKAREQFMASQPDARPSTSVLNPPKSTETSPELNVPKSIDNDDKFRLLMEICGFTLSRIAKSAAGCNTQVTLDGNVATRDLQNQLRLLKELFVSTVDFDASAMIKRVSTKDAKKRALEEEEVDDEMPLFILDESEDDYENINDDMFAPVERVKQKSQGSSAKPKKSKGRRESKRRRREENIIANTTMVVPKAYKSADFIRPSDDESDDERDRLFFERERQLRESLQKGTQAPSLDAEVDRVYNKDRMPVVAPISSDSEDDLSEAGDAGDHDDDEEEEEETERDHHRMEVDSARDDLAHMAEREDAALEVDLSGEDLSSAGEEATSSKPNVLRKRRIVDDSDSE